MILRILFGLIASLGLLMALGTVLARNLVHAALFLVGFFFLVACQFVLLEAEFIAAMQVLVYIGAVAILLLFGIMLTRNIQGDETTTGARRGWKLPAALAGAGVFAVLAVGIGSTAGPSQLDPWTAIKGRTPIADLPPGRARAITDQGRVVGIELMTRYAVPFEVAGLMLTAALVGAVALARRDGDDDDRPRMGAIATVPAGMTDGDGAGGEAPGHGNGNGNGRHASRVEPPSTPASAPR